MKVDYTYHELKGPPTTKEKSKSGSAFVELLEYENGWAVQLYTPVYDMLAGRFIYTGKNYKQAEFVYNTWRRYLSLEAYPPTVFFVWFEQTAELLPGNKLYTEELFLVPCICGVLD